MNNINFNSFINFIFKIIPCLLLMYFSINQPYYLVNNVAQVFTFIYTIYMLSRSNTFTSMFLILSNIIFSFYTNTGIQNEITYLQIFQMGTIYLFFIFINSKNVKFKNDANKKNNIINKDYSTGLYNKRFLDRLISVELEPNKVDTNMIAIDIDDFNLLTLNHGYENSEAILKKVAKIIKNKVKDNGYSCRIFGERFIVLVEKNNDLDIKKLAFEIKELLETTDFDLDDRVLNIGTNIVITSSSNFLNHKDYFNHTMRMLDSVKLNLRNDIMQSRKVNL